MRQIGAEGVLKFRGFKNNFTAEVRMRSTLLSIIVGICLAFTADAQCREAGSIRVPKGQNTATVTGTVSASRAVCYKFRGKTGQQVLATIASPNKYVRFSIIPDAYDVDAEETGDTTNWNGRLSGNYGDDYIVSIHTARGSGTYTLKMKFK
jgi:hypothetical protein